MIVLDTNVVSELMRLEPDPEVLAWMELQVPAQVFTTAVTKAEVMFGIETMPIGKRRLLLEKSANRTFWVNFSMRILPFDSGAAELYAAIAAHRRSLGKPISYPDAQIAAIVRSHPGATLATRDTADFDRCGINLINPWLVNPRGR